MFSLFPWSLLTLWYQVDSSMIWQLMLLLICHNTASSNHRRILLCTNSWWQLEHRLQSWLIVIDTMDKDAFFHSQEALSSLTIKVHSWLLNEQWRIIFCFNHKVRSTHKINNCNLGEFLNYITFKFLLKSNASLQMRGEVYL